MAINPLSQTTTFSGSDITVIAYRNNLDTEALGKFDQLQEDIQNSREAEGANREQLFDLESQSSQLRSDYAAKRQQYLNSYENADGVAQNQMNIDLDALEKQSDNISLQKRKLIQQNKNITALSLEAETELENFNSLHNFQFELGSIHTISYSSFREKFAVRSLGVVQAKSYTRGPRTVAGTLVFNTMQEHELYRLGGTGIQDTNQYPGAVMLDQIPPFNLLLVFSNEYGVYSSMHLFDVEIATEGQSMSIDELVTRNTMNFYAKEMLPMTSLGNAFESESAMFADFIKKEQARGNKYFNKSNPGKVYKDAAKLDIRFSSGDTSSREEVQRMLAESRGLF